MKTHNPQDEPESKHDVPDKALLTSLLEWMPLCCECRIRLATHQQTWSDRGPIYYCDQAECAALAQQHHDGDSLADQTGLERDELKWAETVRLIEAVSHTTQEEAV